MFQLHDHLARDSTSNVTQGRVICRLVSMFQSIDELVEENDRRCSLEADGDDILEYTLQ
jgi:hypothetical protein